MSSRYIFPGAIGITVLMAGLAVAQTRNSESKPKPVPAASPHARGKAQAARAVAESRKGSETAWRRWMQEDVAYIVKTEERQAFSRSQSQPKR